MKLWLPCLGLTLLLAGLAYYDPGRFVIHFVIAGVAGLAIAIRDFIYSRSDARQAARAILEEAHPEHFEG